MGGGHPELSAGVRRGKTRQTEFVGGCAKAAPVEVLAWGATRMGLKQTMFALATLTPDNVQNPTHMTIRTRFPLPDRVALAQLGADLKHARRRRRIPMAYAAARALISRTTLHKLEHGGPGVSLGAYATVLFHFGMIQWLESLVDKRFDWIGLASDEERVPRRIRSAADREIVHTLPLDRTIEKLPDVLSEGAW